MQPTDGEYGVGDTREKFVEEVMDVDGVSLVMELDEAYRGFGDREVSGFLSWCLEDEEDAL